MIMYCAVLPTPTTYSATVPTNSFANFLICSSTTPSLSSVPPLRPHLFAQATPRLQIELGHFAQTLDAALSIPSEKQTGRLRAYGFVIIRCLSPCQRVFGLVTARCLSPCQRAYGLVIIGCLSPCQRAYGLVIVRCLSPCQKSGSPTTAPRDGRWLQPFF